MNKNYTLKELADIAKDAAEKANKESQEVQWGAVMAKADRPGFIWSETVKAVLDAIGYEFPKDEEREAFERWQKSMLQGFGGDQYSFEKAAFEAWKAGREELRRAQLLDKQPAEPAWIAWEGGECPVSMNCRRLEVRFRDGEEYLTDGAYGFIWSHSGAPGDILAYRVWEG